MSFACEDCGDMVAAGPRGAYKNRTHSKCRACFTRVRQFIKCVAAWGERQCGWCGVRFSSAKLRYCSAECRHLTHAHLAKKKREATPVVMYDRLCDCCGVKFSYQHLGTERKYCSRKCQKSAYEQVRRAIQADNDNSHQPPMPVAYRVFRESGWVCAACGIDTPEVLRGTYELNAPEIDHIVPLSRGGTHDRSNLQCLCKSCNSSKGAKLMSEWLAVAA